MLHQKTVNLLAIRLLLSCLSLAGVTICQAQSDSGHVIPPRASFYVYTEPVSLIDIINGSSFRAGIGFALNKKWALYGGTGLYFEQGFTARAGIKRYVYAKQNTRYSFSLEWFGAWHTHHTRCV